MRIIAVPYASRYIYQIFEELNVLTLRSSPTQLNTAKVTLTGRLDGRQVFAIQDTLGQLDASGGLEFDIANIVWPALFELFIDGVLRDAVRLVPLYTRQNVFPHQVLKELKLELPHIPGLTGDFLVLAHNPRYTEASYARIGQKLSTLVAQLDILKTNAERIDTVLEALKPSFSRIIATGKLIKRLLLMLFFGTEDENEDQIMQTDFSTLKGIATRDALWRKLKSAADAFGLNAEDSRFLAGMALIALNLAWSGGEEEEYALAASFPARPEADLTITLPLPKQSRTYITYQRGEYAAFDSPLFPGFQQYPENVDIFTTKKYSLTLRNVMAVNIDAQPTVRREQYLYKGTLSAPAPELPDNELYRLSRELFDDSKQSSFVKSAQKVPAGIPRQSSSSGAYGYTRKASKLAKRQDEQLLLLTPAASLAEGGAFPLEALAFPDLDRPGWRVSNNPSAQEMRDLQTRIDADAEIAEFLERTGFRFALESAENDQYLVFAYPQGRWETWAPFFAPISQFFHVEISTTLPAIAATLGRTSMLDVSVFFGPADQNLPSALTWLKTRQGHTTEVRTASRRQKLILGRTEETDAAHYVVEFSPFAAPEWAENFQLDLDIRAECVRCDKTYSALANVHGSCQYHPRHARLNKPPLVDRSFDPANPADAEPLLNRLRRPNPNINWGTAAPASFRSEGIFNQALAIEPAVPVTWLCCLREGEEHPGCYIGQHSATSILPDLNDWLHNDPLRGTEYINEPRTSNAQFADITQRYAEAAQATGLLREQKLLEAVQLEAQFNAVHGGRLQPGLELTSETGKRALSTLLYAAADYDPAALRNLVDATDFRRSFGIWTQDREQMLDYRPETGPKAAPPELAKKTLVLYELFTELRHEPDAGARDIRVLEFLADQKLRQTAPAAPIVQPLPKPRPQPPPPPPPATSLDTIDVKDLPYLVLFAQLMMRAKANLLASERYLTALAAWETALKSTLKMRTQINKRSRLRQSDKDLLRKLLAPPNVQSIDSGLAN